MRITYGFVELIYLKSLQMRDISYINAEKRVMKKR